jgi:hypothetical protein
VASVPTGRLHETPINMAEGAEGCFRSPGSVQSNPVVEAMPSPGRDLNTDTVAMRRADAAVVVAGLLMAAGAMTVEVSTG